MTDIELYTSGYDDSRAGKDIRENPYDVTAQPREWQLWQRGWVEGHRSPALPFGTHITITPGDRHELLTAYVVDHNRTSDGHRYRCIFPFLSTARWANVYSTEIETVGDVDEAETLRLMEATR